jgi:hypothetical protein
MHGITYHTVRTPLKVVLGEATKSSGYQDII